MTDQEQAAPRVVKFTTGQPIDWPNEITLAASIVIGPDDVIVKHRACPQLAGSPAWSSLIAEADLIDPVEHFADRGRTVRRIGIGRFALELRRQEAA